MTAITGEIAALFDLLGSSKDDERIMRSLEASASFREQDAFVDPARGDDVRVTIHNRGEGFEYRFVDGVLDKIVIHAQHEANWDPYPRPTELIDGLDIATAGVEDVLRVLGEPWKSDATFTKHKVGKRYLHTSFLNGKVSRLVVMARPR